MDARWFRPVVVILWISTMTWLTVEKVLPQLLRGDPPTYRSILAGDEGTATNAWALYLNDQEIGVAETRVEKSPAGQKLLHHRLNISKFRFQELLPDALKRLLRSDLVNLAPTSAAIRGTIELDANDQLKRLEADVRWGTIRDFIHLSGIVKEDELRIFAVAMGNVALPPTKIPLTTQTVLCESLAPLGQIPGLRIGQKWTVPVFSPLQPTSPVEYLRAEVTRTEPLMWNERVARCFVIEYTRQSGVGGPHDLQGQVWVRDDGFVLKQEARLLNAKLTFVRHPPDSTLSIENFDDE